MRRKRIFGTALAALVLAGAAAVAGWQGLQTCGWLDRVTGGSGCLGRVSFDGVGLSQSSTAHPLGDGRVVISADMRTADGWRPGLIVLDPVTGAEAGRYPLPMRGMNPRLFLSPDGTRLLIACGVIEPSCTEWGGDAVITDSDDLRNFQDFPLEDLYLGSYPGTPTPAGDYGREAVLAAQGTRIVDGGGMRPLVLLDAEGTLIAELSGGGPSAFPAAVSTAGIIARGESRPSGDHIRFWDVRDGTALGRIEGSDGWRLSAGPFWSRDGGMLFVPRQHDGTMLLNRFRAP
ncbi:hypothetical protein PY32053_04431 (plasmid) [Paracoccus yeei]|uniref:Uncharacterized protein n=1 Tax=Paracoccus yeei TaxID=147645 RepID=A0A386UUS9_9RHOB|nr:hypothetical protein [Paracoccus yeei]AYF03940.1 hypothetical protein PY32053_04431 [Paracoccus yeei]